MSAKKVTFGSQPTPRPDPAPTPDQWVDQRTTDARRTRMTFDVPESLHRRVKAECTLRGVTICAVIVALLERQFPA